MADIPTITSPTDGSTVDPPFSIQGGSTALLVEARGENGLLLPATQNPVVPSAGSYTIVGITSLIGTYNAGYAVLGGSIENAGSGVSDDFNRADGEMGANWLSAGWNWNTADAARPRIIGNRALPPAGSTTDGQARWAGPAVSNDHRTSCQAGIGSTVANTYQGPCLAARFQDDGNAIFMRSRHDTDGVTHEWHCYVKVGGAQVWQSTPNTTDLWARIEVVGTTATFFTSADGVTWTQRATTTQAGLTWSAQPGFWWAGGYGAGGTAETYFIDNWSAENM